MRPEFLFGLNLIDPSPPIIPEISNTEALHETLNRILAIALVHAGLH